MREGYNYKKDYFNFLSYFFNIVALLYIILLWVSMEYGINGAHCPAFISQNTHL